MTFFSARRLFIKGVILMAVSAAVVVFGNQDGPPDRMTGALGDLNCTICHSDYELGAGLGKDGRLVFDGVPAEYTPGEFYLITVRIAQPGQTRWGFEAAARFMEDGRQAGTLFLIDEKNTQLSETGGVQFIKHTSMGTYDMTADGPVEWMFFWLAPEAGTVVFSAAGNAADGNNKPEGDYIYAIQAMTSPVQ